MTEPSHAVFLSYASQDAQAAQRICQTLRAAGIEVWFDQSELRGGDAWDQSIRKQIKTCALFIPVISRHTHERREGYFRLEWNLALDRSRLISTTQAFFVPVVIDDTREDDEEVPEKIRDIHWTRLPGGVAPAAFIERVQRLLSGETSITARAHPESGTVAAIGGRSLATGWSRRVLPVAVAVVVLGAMVYLAVERPWISKPAASATFAPPPHSIAVLPFVNMSGDKDQEYFSDGLTEELLNSLTQINELQVAARTSAFSFKGTNTDIGTIARKLNVGVVLEGSVRRSGNTVRITTQLINALTGFHLWSHTYDRDLGDVLKLETEIANAVARALQVNLLGDVATKIALGGTLNPAAFDAYLRGRKAELDSDGGIQTVIAAYTEAIRLDPNYSLAFANRSLAFSAYAVNASGPAIRESLDKAQSDARKAFVLAPDLAEGHVALASYWEALLDFSRANEEYERAFALAPGNAEVLRIYSAFAGPMGRTEAAIAAARRAVVLDPLNRHSHSYLGVALYWARQNKEAIAAYQDALALAPDDLQSSAFRGFAYYALGDFEGARASCETKRQYWAIQQCLAITYERLGRHADAASMVAKITAAQGDASAYQYAAIDAQMGNIPKALDWLETALRLRDSGLDWLKVDPLLDPLRREPRFQAIERELKFPR